MIENPQHQMLPRAERTAQQVPFIFSVTVSLIAILVLLGWSLDLELLKRLQPQFVAMNPATALALLCAGLSLACSRHPAQRIRRIGLWLAGVVFLIGSLKLLDLTPLLNIPVDRLLFGNVVASEVDAITGRPNRMAPNTALNFILVGSALLLMFRSTRANVQPLLFAALFIAILPVVGYTYGTRAFTGIGTYIPMALHTALAFTLLILGTLAAQPRRGIMQVIIGNSLGGVLARRVLPLAVLLPYILGWLRLAGEREGLFNRELGTSLLITLMMAILAALLLWYAHVLHVSDLTRRAGERQLLAQAREMAQVAAYAQAIADVSKLLEVDLDPIQAAERTVRTISKVAGIDWAGVVQLEVREGRTWAVMKRRWQAGEINQGMATDLADGIPKGQGLVWHVFESGKPLYIDNYPQQATAVQRYVAAGVASLAFIPLSREPGQELLLAAVRVGEPRAWSERDRELFGAASRIIGVTQERRANLQYMQEAALNDALTGLGNRRAFDHDLEKEAAAAARHQYEVAVMMMDLDGLKALNDQEGHERGDAVLKAFGEALRASVRSSDRLYRLGGDEYAVILPHAAPLHTLTLLGHARKAIGLVQGGGFPDMDVSVGVAFYPVDAGDIKTVVRLADERMYEEKRDHHLLKSPVEGHSEGSEAP